MKKHSVRLCLLVAASAGAMIASAASAQEVVSTESQEAPAQEEGQERIIVTGTRASLENAERVKRDANVMMDGINADDMGALPDASMTEAVIRIPGAYSNDNGALSARGLGPDFIQQQINGRILPSPAAGTRRVQTGSYPTEGLSGVYLQKTPDAATIEGGAGGSILLQTIRPLETKRSGLEVVIRGYSNSNSAKLSAAHSFANVAPRISATLVKKLSSNFGIALTYARVNEYKSAVQSDGSAWRFGTAPRTDLNGDGRLDALPQTLGTQINATNDFRNSASGMAQWDITPSLRASLDGFYNEDKFQNYNRRFFGFQIFQGNSGATNSATVNQYDTVVAFNGPVAGYRGIVNYADGKDTTYGGGLNLAFDNGGLISFKVDGSYYKATRRTRNPNFTFENDAATLAGQRLPFSYDVSDPFHTITNFQELAPEDYALANGSIGTEHVDDSIAAIRADFTYKPRSDEGFLKSINFGLRADRRHKISLPLATNYTFGLTNPAVAGSAVNYALRPDLDGSFLLSANPIGGRSLVNSGTGTGNWPWFDINKLAGLITAPGTNSTIAASLINGYIDNTENTEALYAQANFGTGMLTGNIGVRYILTDSKIAGLQGTVTNNSRLMVNSSYGYLLPELNAKLGFTRTLMLRLGLSKTMTRPNFGDTKIAGSFDPVVAAQNGFATVNTGNPNLKPYTAKGVDLSLEWYPGNGTSFAVASYVKFVDGYLRQVTQNGTVLVNGGILPAIITTQINDPAVKRFSGFEISLRKDLNFLPGFLSGLGVYANWNHSYTDAKENVASLLLQPTVDIAANNFAKDIINAQVYYSRGPLDLRVAYRYFTWNSQTALSPVNYRGIPDGTIDISGGYSFTKNIRFIFSMTNVMYGGAYQFTPDYRYPANNYQANKTLLLNTTDAGRVIQAGVRFQF
jgi:iron complex outermembrane receptor protein